MSRLNPELETFAKIKVVGVGGGGTNAVTRMFNTKIKGVDFVSVNTDAQDLHHAQASLKIHIGKGVTRGLGTGMNPELGRQAAEEAREEIQDALKGSDLVFVTCGLGGGTGSGASSVVAEAAKDLGALVIGVITKPFTFEGVHRSRIAEEALVNLRSNVDALVVIPNDRIFNMISDDTSFVRSFEIVDDVLRQAVQGISDLITLPGIINVDFNDVKAIMQDAGSALMGIGIASGEDRAKKAAQMAINSPLLEVSIEGAKGVLFNVSGGPDLGMMEINQAAQVITDSVDKDAKIIFGAVNDTRLKKGEIKITVIAAGFGGATGALSQKNIITNRVMPAMSRMSGETAGNMITSKVELKDKQADNISFGSNKKQEPKTSRAFAPEIIKIMDETWDVPAFIRRKK